MSQVSSNGHNEFVFGEKGGRGKNLLSFLKNLSLTGPLLSSHKSDNSDDKWRTVNSSIYGELTYGYKSSDTGGMALPKQGDKGRRLTLQQFFPYAYNKLREAANGGGYDGGDSASNGSYGSNGAAGSNKSGSRIASRLGSPLFRHASSSMSALEASLRPSVSRKAGYADLDDDWDSNIDDFDHLPAIESAEQLQPSPDLIDMFHPDLIGFELTPRHLNDQTNTLQQQMRSLIDSVVRRAEYESQILIQKQGKLAKFHKVLLQNDGTINLRELRELSWKGIPAELRASVWQLLVGYSPANTSRQAAILKRKRSEYAEGLKNLSTQILFKDDSVISSSADASSASVPGPRDSNNKDNSVNKDKVLYHQIKIDVKRTNPTMPLYSLASTQQSLKKILYLWAVRHPASGYVQGINDLCTPFYQIFLGNYLWQMQCKAAFLAGTGENMSALFIPDLLSDTSDPDLVDKEEQALLLDPKLQSYTAETFDPALLSDRVTAIIEADTYWCLSRLLETITDNYIHEQPGILRQVSDLRNLILKIDPELLRHFEAEGVEFIQFLFRWMNCLLMREVSVQLIIRMWDTYLSETPLGFNLFHVYVCAAFLIKFSSELKEKDFQDILLFLQNPPTSNWTENDIEVMLSEAFVWQSLYVNAGAHLR